MRETYFNASLLNISECTMSSDFYRYLYPETILYQVHSIVATSGYLHEMWLILQLPGFHILTHVHYGK